MADKGPGSTGRSSGKKRLARAKIKPTEHGIKSSKGRQQVEVEELTRTQKQTERKKRLTAIGVGIFAVIMALSMMLPSLSYIFGNSAEQQAAADAEADAKEAEEQQKAAEDADETTTSTNTGMDAVDANFKAVVDPLEEKLAANDQDLATLLNLGNDYMAWAQQASSYASADEDYAHISDLYNKAIERFDQYLELNDSSAVKVNRALCQLYMGDYAAATTALEDLTQETPDYGPAWANLGMVREYQGDQDGAKEAYQKAVEVDPDDEYGSKGYANRRLAAMAAQQNSDLSEETGGAATEGKTDEQTGAAALSDALAAGGKN